MARSHGRIMATIWTDPDFIAMDSEAQRLYLFLLSQPDLSHAGLLPLRMRRWTQKVAGVTTADLEKAAQRLQDERFIVVDDDTEEVLVRTFVRNDGVYKQPKVMVRLREDARQIESPRLRAEFRAELDRLPLDELSTAATGRNGDGPSTREAVEGVVDALRADFSDVPEYPPGRVSDTPSDTPRVRACAFPQPPTTVPQPPAPIVSGAADADADADASKAVEVVRDDVDRICEHLADRIEANGSKRPTITAKWRDSARLMLDRDGRTEQEVHGAIDWCQADEFWRSNILSLPKLREKYDTLRLQAERRAGSGRQRETDAIFDAALARARGGAS